MDFSMVNLAETYTRTISLIIQNQLHSVVSILKVSDQQWVLSNTCRALLFTKTEKQCHSI